MTATATPPEFQTSRKTRILYSLTSLGVATPAEAISGIIALYIADVKNVPATWYGTFWILTRSTTPSITRSSVICLTAPLSLLLAAGASLAAGDPSVLTAHLLRLACLLLLLATTIIFLGPRYRRWHANMRRRDERDQAGIFH